MNDTELKLREMVIQIHVLTTKAEIVAQRQVDALCAHLPGTYFANRNTSSLLFIVD